MTANTLNLALERMRFDGSGSTGFSAHAFRATASTILNEMGSGRVVLTAIHGEDSARMLWINSSTLPELLSRAGFLRETPE